VASNTTSKSECNVATSTVSHPLDVEDWQSVPQAPTLTPQRSSNPSVASWPRGRSIDHVPLEFGDAVPQETSGTPGALRAAARLVDPEPTTATW